MQTAGFCANPDTAFAILKNGKYSAVCESISGTKHCEATIFIPRQSTRCATPKSAFRIQTQGNNSVVGQSVADRIGLKTAILKGSQTRGRAKPEAAVFVLNDRRHASVSDVCRQRKVNESSFLELAYSGRGAGPK